MRKIFLAAVAAIVSLSASALPPYIFDHVGANLSIGTTGIGIEATTPITQWVTMRAGVAIMPNFKFHTDVDASINAQGYDYDDEINVELGMGRVQGDVIFNIYPVPQVTSFYVAAGAYFGGKTLLSIKGHSEEARKHGGELQVAGYSLPFDTNGDVKGGFKVNGFRPYLGIGFGRALPKGRLAFNVELGVQFEGTPKVYSKTGSLKELPDDAEESLENVTKYLKVYPVLSFKLAGRIF